jgi:methionyl-tRNA formyltransferase
MEVAVSPVKEAALRLNLPVTQPDRIKNNDDFKASSLRSSLTESSWLATGASFRSG